MVVPSIGRHLACARGGTKENYQFVADEVKELLGGMGMVSVSFDHS